MKKGRKEENIGRKVDKETKGRIGRKKEKMVERKKIGRKEEIMVERKKIGRKEEKNTK